MASINAKSLAEQISDYISEKIIRNELKPGERILEAAISAKFEVSRSPVREALRILERKQLVEIIPRKGARVTLLDHDYINSLFDILSTLYSLAAMKTVEKAGPDEIAIANIALDKIRKSAEKGSTEEYFEGIFEYVKLGLLYTGNPILEKMLNDFLEMNKRIQYLVFKENKEPLMENFQYFLDFTDALVVNDSKKAGSIIETYVQNEKVKALKIINKYNQAGD